MRATRRNYAIFRCPPRGRAPVRVTFCTGSVHKPLSLQNINLARPLVTKLSMQNTSAYDPNDGFYDLVKAL
jgi:hypothetical protein